MKQYREEAFPGCLEGVSHYPTSDFLSNPDPSFGETVTFRIRVPANAPIRCLVLCTAPNGESLFTAMKPEQDRGEYTLWSARLTLSEPCVPYYFGIVTDQQIWWLDAAGVHQELPLLAAQFKLLTDQSPISWLRDAVFYQIFPDRFANGDPSNDPIDQKDPETGRERSTFPWGQPHACTRMFQPFYGGDLQGVSQHLDYLEDLGINAIYFNPIFTAWTNHRYDVSDYASVDPVLGGDQALIDLAGRLHEKGMHYILDIVPNHCGIGHPWFKAALADAQAAERAYFYISQDKQDWVSWMGVKTLPKLNYRSQGLREKIYGKEGVFPYWLRPPYNADGWRVDVGNMLGRQNDDQFADEVIQGIRRAVKETKPEAYLFGENFFEASGQLQGDEWDGVMNYMGFSAPLKAWLRPFKTGAIFWEGELVSDRPWSTASLMRTWLTHLAAIPWRIAQQQFNLLDSHDTPRILTAMDGNKELVKLAFCVLFAFPGVPCIYYGDEIALQDEEGFEQRACFPWQSERWDQDMRSFLQKLITLRKGNDALKDGAFIPLYAGKDLLLFARQLSDKVVIVSANRSETVQKPLIIDVPELGLSGTRNFTEFFSGQKSQVIASRFQLPAHAKGAKLWISD